MTSTAIKGNLDKAKLQLRRPTPDSDVLASSDDDREHTLPPIRPTPGGYPGGRRPSSGWLQDIQPNRKYSLPSVSFAGSQPTTPALEQPQQSRATTAAFPWNTNSFTSAPSGSRLKEVVPSPTSAHPLDKAQQSPTSLEADDGIGFLLNQPNTMRKAVRSQSYSIGQGDIESSPVGKFSAHLRSNLRHRPSKPSLLSESTIGLAQLREDDVDDIESSNGSEHGVRLPAGYWEREHKQALLKQAAVENARARNRATSTSSPLSQQRRKTTAGLRNSPYNTAADFAVDETDDHDPTSHAPPLSLTRRFSEQVPIPNNDNDMDLVESSGRSQWASEAVPTLGGDALGRRHSFAHYSSYAPHLHLSTLSNTQEEDEDVVSPRQVTQSPTENEAFDINAYFGGYGPASRAINASAISAAHPAPVVAPTVAPSVTSANMSGSNPYAVPQVLGRPGRRLFVVEFKCKRADIYYLHENTGLEVRRGDTVVVDGDRGWDIGQVRHADVTLEEARRLKAQSNEEHLHWLVMFSQYSLAGASNDSGMLGSLARARGPSAIGRSPMTPPGVQQEQDSRPKMIKRVAQEHEANKLTFKEGQEAKAKRLGAQKAAEHRLPMEILDAEYQADYNKLTYFYYAEAYVNFNDLVVDLFKQYKVRIWMSAVNPASVVNPAGLMQIPLPSAIGPGAILNPGTARSTLPIGPGFGNNDNNTRRPNEPAGPSQTNAAPNNYNDPYYAFSHQLPAYPAQGNFLPSWSQPAPVNQPSFERYGYPSQTAAYPNAPASGSPMNFGAWYPPAAPAPQGYNSGSSASPFRGGYPASNTHTPRVATTGASPLYGQQGTAGVANHQVPYNHNGNIHLQSTAPSALTNNGATGGSGASRLTSSSPAFSGSTNSDLIIQLHNMKFGN